MALLQLEEYGFPFAALLPTLVEEYLHQKAQHQSMLTFLDSRDREIKFLHELSVVLQTSMDLEEVLSVAGLELERSAAINYLLTEQAGQGDGQLSGYER